MKNSDSEDYCSNYSSSDDSEMSDDFMIYQNETDSKKSKTPKSSIQFDSEKPQSEIINNPEVASEYKSLFLRESEEYNIFDRMDSVNIYSNMNDAMDIIPPEKSEVVFKEEFPQNSTEQVNVKENGVINTMDLTNSFMNGITVDSRTTNTHLYVRIPSIYDKITFIRDGEEKNVNFVKRKRIIFVKHEKECIVSLYQKYLLTKGINKRAIARMIYHDIYENPVNSIHKLIVQQLKKKGEYRTLDSLENFIYQLYRKR